MTGQAVIFNGDAGNLPLPDDSVDLVVTSPPYLGLRAYKDGDRAYAGQIGSEATPTEFLEALWTVTAELRRVIRSTGSIFVNLGDKYAGSGGHNNAGVGASKERGPSRYNQAADGVPNKSLLGLPWRYANGCVDRLGLILRAEIIWDKPNGLPESVDDRVRRNHEQWFHLTKSGTYYSAIDEIREPYKPATAVRYQSGYGLRSAEPEELTKGYSNSDGGPIEPNPAGKLPGSVWTVPTEPLLVPEAVKEMYNLPDHFAAFPTEWPYRFIKAFSPPAICLVCGEGRAPVVERTREVDYSHVDQHRGPGAVENNPTSNANAGAFGRWLGGDNKILGYACRCCPSTLHPGTGESSGRSYAEGVASGEYTSNDFGGRLADRPRVSGWREWHLDQWTPPPSRPAVVLDPFGGSGTTAMVARQLGRIGIHVDRSADYCRLARWRIFQSDHWRKTRNRELERSVQTFDL